MTTGGWGVGQWGVSPWGLGTTEEAPTFGRIYATGDRRVRVSLTFEPAHSSVIASGDALNPRTWIITEPVTGRRFRVLAVSEVSSTEYDLNTLELLANAQITLQLASTTLRYSNGAPVLNFFIDFAGQVATYNATLEAQTAAAGYSLRDVANPPTPNSPVGGTLQVTAGGDYKSVTGASLIRKLIMRRLVSTPGDFFHLPTYGAGLAEKVPLAATDLRRLTKLIEDQVKLEPSVDAVKVQLSMIAASQTLVVQMQVRLRQTGDMVAVGLAVSNNAVQAL